MGEIRTKEEAIITNDARIRNVNQAKGITKDNIAENFEDIWVNLFDGAAASRSVVMTGNMTYSAKLHRGAKIIVKNLSSAASFSILTPLADTDFIFILNRGGFDINLNYNLSTIKNFVDDQTVTKIQTGGYAVIFKDKEAASPTNQLWIGGTKLSQTTTFQANATYPRTSNPTTTGGTFEGNFTRNYQYWVQIVADGAAPPSLATIKSQSGGLANFTNTGNANATKATAFIISGVAPNTPYDIYWVVEPTDGTLGELSGKIDFTTEASPAVGNIVLRSTQFIRQGDGNLVDWDFTCDVDGIATSVMLVEISFRSGTGHDITSLVIGGKTFTRIATAITTGTSNPNYDFLYMATKSGMPTNGTDIAGTITMTAPNNTAARASLGIDIIILEGASQTIIPSPNIKIFAATGVSSHVHNFTGLPGFYMLISFGSTRDPDDTVFLNFPASQIGITQGEDTELVSKAVSYKTGSSASNQVEVTNGHTDKLNHIAVLINPA